MANPSRNGSARIVEQALSFQRPEHLPVYDSGFWEEFADNWRAARGLGPDHQLTDAFRQDLFVARAGEQPFFSRIGELRREGDWIYSHDGWGRTVRTRPGAQFSQTVDRLLKKPGDLDGIEFDRPDLDERYTQFSADVEREISLGKAVFAKIGGLFIRTSFFRGETEYLIDLAADESFARALTERMAEHLLAIGLESLRRAKGRDVGVFIFDDMCSVNAPMFSPRIFERIFVPIYQRMVSTLKAAGARRVLLHCDGNLTPLLDLVIEAGFDAVNPVEANAGMDVVELLGRYHGRLAFIGGVCNTQVLPGGDLGRIERHIRSIVDAGREGGLVIGTHSIGPDVPVEAFELYRRIVETEG